MAFSHTAFQKNSVASGFSLQLAMSNLDEMDTFRFKSFGGPTDDERNRVVQETTRNYRYPRGSCIGSCWLREHRNN